MPASLFAFLGTVQLYMGKAFVVLRSSEMCGKCLISAYTKMPASSDDLNLCSYLSSGTCLLADRVEKWFYIHARI